MVIELEAGEPPAPTHSEPIVDGDGDPIYDDDYAGRFHGLLRSAGCALCGEEVRRFDAVVGDDGFGGSGVAHIACTKDGVERWCREGQPGDDPLDWARSTRPRWSLPGTRRALGRAHGGGTVVWWAER